MVIWRVIFYDPIITAYALSEKYSSVPNGECLIWDLSNEIGAADVRYITRIIFEFHK